MNRGIGPTWLATVMTMLLCVALMGCGSNESSGQAAEPAAPLGWAESVDTYVETIMERNGIPGAALAIVQGGKLVHRKNYGYASLEHQVPIHDQSIFRVYSISKVFVASAMFDWVDDGTISLEDPIDRYVADLPSAWQNIQIKQLLAHTSGLPDINEYRGADMESAKQRVFLDPIRFSPGERYDYNQTNTWLLRELANTLTDGSADAWLLESQFPNSSDTEVFFSSDSGEPIRNRATAYFPFATGRRKIEVPFDDTYAHFSNGINLTVDALLDWNSRLDAGTLVSPSAHSKLLEPYPYREDSRLFGHGWGLYPVMERNSYGFTGSLVTALRKFPEDDLAIILLGNGMGYFFDIDAVVEHVAALIDSDLANPERMAEEQLVAALFANDSTAGLQQARDLHAAGNSSQLEAQLNSIGYGLLARERTQDALEIFELNAELFPNSFNVYDSLAEGYESAGRDADAAAYYRKSLKFNPANSHAIERLKILSPQP